MVRDVAQRQIPEPLPSFHLVPLLIGLVSVSGSRLVPRPAPGIDSHTIGPLEPSGRLEDAKGHVQMPGGHSAGEQRLEVRRMCFGEPPGAP